MAGQLTVIKNAQIMPLLGTMDGFTAGVFCNGEFVEGSTLERARPSKLYPVQGRLAGVYIFGGYLFGHFGHFLLESMSRLYAIKHCRSDYPVLFLSPNTKLYESQALLLKTMGVNNDLMLLKDPVEVENLIYAPPAVRLKPPFISDEQLEALGRFNISPDPSGRKIWLSRSKFHGGKVVNENKIEKIISEWGWEIVHPELISLQDQLKAVHSARYIAGFDGSAFYSSLLSRKTHGHFIIFGRRNVIPEELRYFLQRKKVSFEEHVFPVEYISGEGDSSLFHLPDITRVTNILAAIPSSS